MDEVESARVHVTPQKESVFSEKEKGAKAFDFNSDAYYDKIKGVWTHTNTRRDKFDMFPQDELLEMLTNL